MLLAMSIECQRAVQLVCDEVGPEPRGVEEELREHCLRSARFIGHWISYADPACAKERRGKTERVKNAAITLQDK